MNESGVVLQRKDQKYFLLNINEEIKKDKRENKVCEWIEQKKFAPIYYDKWTKKEILSGEALGDKLGKKKLTSRQRDGARFFLETFENISDNNIVFSIGNKKIYFFQQKSELEERAYKNWLIKGFNIKNLKHFPIVKCPLVLANIKANRNLSSGTFKQLKDEKRYYGNIKAIEYIWDHEGKTPIHVKNYPERIKCLSSVEFETLIAKILEEKGLFVSAYRGGCMPNIDLICRNLGGKPIKLGDNEIKLGDSKSIQIKLELEKKDYDEQNGADFYFCIESRLKKGKDYDEQNGADFYFCIESRLKKGNVFDANYIQTNLGNTTREWLEESLSWTKIVKC